MSWLSLATARFVGRQLSMICLHLTRQPACARSLLRSGLEVNSNNRLFAHDPGIMTLTYPPNITEAELFSGSVVHAHGKTALNNDPHDMLERARLLPQIRGFTTAIPGEPFYLFTVFQFYLIFAMLRF
jgi:hypothetical protein